MERYSTLNWLNYGKSSYIMLIVSYWTDNAVEVVCMYDTLRRPYYLSHMARRIYRYFEESRDYRSHWRHSTYQRRRQLLPPVSLLEIVALDILGPLPRTKYYEDFIVLKSDRFYRLSRAISTRETTDAHIAKLFLDTWVMPYKNFEPHFTDNRPQLAGMYSIATRVLLVTKLLEINAYRSTRTIQWNATTRR